MRPDRFVVQLLVGAVAVAYVVWLVVENRPLSDVPTPWGLAVSVAWIVWVVFDRWAWHWPGVSELAGRRPNIQGTWRGSLASEWVDPLTEARVEPDSEVFLVVRETFSTVSAQLLTRESKSETIAATVERDGIGPSLVGVYRNIPKSGIRDRSVLHYGGFILDIEGEPAGRLDGWYWTDRGTKGELRLDRRIHAVVHSFDAAKELKW